MQYEMKAKIIKKENGKLIVPVRPTIPYIIGDGIGAEITPIMKAVVDSAVNKAYKGVREIEWLEVLAGEKAYQLTGEWLPEETVSAFADYLVGIKGPLTTPVGGGIRSLNVLLRQKLDLYVCLRPIRWFKGVVTAIKRPQDVNMVVFRENTEDIYSGIEWEAGSVEANKFYKFIHEELGVTEVRFPNSSAFGVKPVSQEGTERLIRAACEYAIAHKLPLITLVHKGNIMKYTEGGFKKWAYELIEKEFGHFIESGLLQVNDVITDAFLQQTILKPENYNVIATLNLNGDYISDQLAALVGGIGIAPGGNINYDTGCAIFEATHGTAPSMVGQNRVNPSSIILSAVMMLEYIGWNKAADLIVNALESSFSSSRATADLARLMDNGTTLTALEFRDLLIERILV